MPGARPDPAQGVFETLLVTDGRVAALDAHLARLTRSARALWDLALPPDLGPQVTEAAATATGARRARIDVVPRARRLDVAITLSAVPARRPVAVAPLRVPGGLGAHKWRDRRLVDGRDPTPLIVDTDGAVLEAAWANVWILDDDTLTTPPLDGRVLPGITRGRLLARAPALGLNVREAPITLAQARATPTLFLTSAAAARRARRAGAPA